MLVQVTNTGQQKRVVITRAQMLLEERSDVFDSEFVPLCEHSKRPLRRYEWLRASQFHMRCVDKKVFLKAWPKDQEENSSGWTVFYVGPELSESEE